MKMYCKMALGNNSSQNSHLYYKRRKKVITLSFKSIQRMFQKKLKENKCLESTLNKVEIMYISMIVTYKFCAKNKELTEQAKLDLLIAMITLK